MPLEADVRIARQAKMRPILEISRDLGLPDDCIELHGPHKAKINLDVLPTLSSDLLLEVPQAAALVHAMTLRAELAAMAGDSVQARRWAGVVVTLWSGGEGDTPAIMSRMRGLSRPN